MTVLAAGASAAPVVLAQPMPPRRPTMERVETPKPPPARTPEAQSEKTPQPEALHAQQPTDGVECLAKLRAGGWDAEPAKPAAGRSECSVPEPVAVKRLRVRDKVVEFPDGPVLDCWFADRLGQWTSDLVIPVVFGGLGTELKAVRTGPGFECRNRNHAASGKLSAHATGLAVDVAGFDLANGDHLLVTEATDQAKIGVLRTLRTGACGWFTTILGPGTDAAHATHWHLDIMKHGSSEYYGICQ